MGSARSARQLRARWQAWRWTRALPPCLRPPGAWLRDSCGHAGKDGGSLERGGGAEREKRPGSCGGAGRHERLRVGGGGGAGRLRGGHHERRCRGESTNGMPGRRPSMTRVDKRHGTSAAIAAPFGTPRAAARARVPTVRVAPLRMVHRRAAWRATVARSELIRPSMDRNTSAFTFTRARCVAHPLMQQGRPTCMKPPHLS